MTTAKRASSALRRLADPVRAKSQAQYLQAFKGGYGEGDRFLGLTVPQVRAVAREHKDLPTTELASLLRSPIHDDRSLSLTIMSARFAKADPGEQKSLYGVFMNGREGINNWDLVDGAAPAVVGAYLFERDRKVLFRLARSRRLWDRRVAMVSAYYFIRQGDFADALALATLLRDDEHDLMHKAVGWMLREIGKRDLRSLERHLEKHGHRMPRTMLRYAIERMTPARRKYFMGLKAARSR